MATNTVYVGRIPYDYTEEQVSDIFRSAGPIQDVRLMFDKDTGKSKGFAFVEYFDSESAASAVRNLNEHPVGHMSLKVDFSSGDSAPGSGGGGGGGRRGGGGGGGQAKGANAGAGAGTGTESAATYIANIINDESRADKAAFLSGLRTLAEADRAQLLRLLGENPQLAYAVVQTMIDMGNIDQGIANTLLPEGAAEAATENGAGAGASAGGGGRRRARGGRSKGSRQGTPAGGPRSPSPEDSPAPVPVSVPTPAPAPPAATPPAPVLAPAAAATTAAVAPATATAAAAAPTAAAAPIAAAAPAAAGIAAAAGAAPQHITSDAEQAMIRQILAIPATQLSELPADQAATIRDVQHKVATGQIILD